MSKDFEYDPETGSFRFDESGGKTKKKNDVDVGGWILIAALFAFGLWPIGHHRAHLQALGQAEKGEFAAQWHAHEHQSERERYGAQYEQGRKDRCADSEKDEPRAEDFRQGRAHADDHRLPLSPWLPAAG